MRRGPGPPDSSPELPSVSAIIAVNQSQGFDTSAFGAPQPSACEVSPKLPRRRASGGIGAVIDIGGICADKAGGGGEGDGGNEDLYESVLRRSLEIDQQPEMATALPFSRGEDGRGKSSSGPINVQQQQQHHQQQPHLHHHQQQQSSPVVPTSPVRRTRSLKENLIKRFNSSVVSGAAGIARAAGVVPVGSQAQPLPQSPKATAEESPAAAGEEIFSFDLIQAALVARATAGAAGGSRSSSPKKAQETSAKHPQQQQQQHQQQQQQQLPTPMSRNRAGSLRGGSVVKVLPDKKLLNKASSSENLSPNAAAADLNSLASLVQKKRDRSQESLEQPRPPQAAAAGGGGSGGMVRKPPTPTPAADSDDGSEVTAALATGASKSKPPSGIARSGPRRLESPTGRGATVAAAPATIATTDDSPTEANDTDRESPGEDQQSDGEVPSIATGGGGAVASSHNRSSSLEFLMQDAQSRTAPQIRHPSARKIEAPSLTSAAATSAPVAAAVVVAAAASARREGSPPKSLASGGSSPPKAVSFNPNDEVKTYEGDYSGGSRHRKHHRGASSHSQQQQSQRQRRPPDGDRNGHSEASSQGRIGDNHLPYMYTRSALIEVHSTMVESMDKMVSKQRQFLHQVKDGSITVSEYREVMKSLLTMQTKTIQQILDAIQSNEKPPS